MRIFALELNNEIKGIKERESYIEALIAMLPAPDLVVLPELAICSYMASVEIWQYADKNGIATEAWATEMARKYNTYIGVGYLDYDGVDYYNRYMLVGKEGALGSVTKSEGEAAVFKRGDFPNIIKTQFGKVAIGICYDSRRKHFYDNIRDEKISLILFPHGAPADPKKPDEEIATNDYFCGAYRDAFGVPVVYVNSRGPLEYMPGLMGKMMADHGFKMNGKSKIYHSDGHNIICKLKEAIGVETNLIERRKTKEIRFFGDDIIKANLLFRALVLKPDIKRGIKSYEKAKKEKKYE